MHVDKAKEICEMVQGEKFYKKLVMYLIVTFIFFIFT
jgi:hypothetical protein